MNLYEEHMKEVVPNTTLYELIYAHAEYHNMSIVKFAQSIGLTAKTIYNVRERKPTMTTYGKIAEGLNIDVRVLKCYPITLNE